MKITLKMAPKRKQVVHLKKIAQERKVSASQPLPDTTNKIDPDMMVVSGLLSGNGYEATRRQALRFNQMTPCKKTFYNHQSKIIKQVNEMVSKDCGNYANKIKKMSHCLVIVAGITKFVAHLGLLQFMIINRKKLLDAKL